jgi:hypothetical protein
MRAVALRAMVALLLGGGAVAAACVGDDPEGAAPAAPDGAVEAEPPPADGGFPIDVSNARCDPRAAFGEAEEIPNITGAAVSEEGARLSPDERTIYFAAVRDSGTWRINMAVRSDPSADFEAMNEVPGVNSLPQLRFPTVTADGQFIYAGYLPASAGSTFNVMYATLDGGVFGPLTAAPGVNTTYHELHPYVLPDHRAMYLTSNRRRNVDHDIYRAARIDGGFSTPEPVVGADLTTDSHEGSPIVTSNELALYFASDRNGGKGSWDIYVARRANVGEGFGAPTNLAAINTSALDLPTYITDDECVLYLTRQPATGGSRIYVARRGR